MPDILSTQYINSSDYKSVEDKLKTLKDVCDDLTRKQETARKLRYAEVDIEAEREANRLQPDELYVPQHTIDTNIRREQSSYIQYITQSPRAVITEDLDNPANDMELLNKDLTKKLRYEGWQLPMFSNVDGFQANGYNVVEVVLNLNNSGELGVEHVSNGDFGFISDTKDIQSCEFTCRCYYYTRTRLLALCGDPEQPNPENDFVRFQVEKIIGREPDTNPTEATDAKDKSLYKIYKVMYRINGVVNVAWCCPTTCDDWVRGPRKLYIGRRKLVYPPTVITTEQQNQYIMQIVLPILLQGGGAQQIPSEEAYETEFPYIVYPYLISENDVISQLKGRIFLDQDLQEAVSSLLSSVVTQARRAAGLYFSKNVEDPNDDLLLQKNIFFKSGCLINSKVQAFELKAPDPGMFSAIQLLLTNNQNETSQTNFATMNRKDSRKTATEMLVSQKQEQILSTVQVVLFSIALTQMYRTMVGVIKSRVLSGLIKCNQLVLPLYATRFSVKPSGDVDVIERQQLLQLMGQVWPIVAETPIAMAFLSDFLSLAFPERAAKYLMILNQAIQQQQSQQTQMMQQGMMMAKQMADGIVSLSKKPEMFSETGKIHALPRLEMAAEQIENIQSQLVNNKTQ